MTDPRNNPAAPAPESGAADDEIRRDPRHKTAQPAPETGATNPVRYASDLRAANILRQAEWDAGNQLTLTYRLNELAGETGEACNIGKKIERERLGIRGSRATVEQLAEELADVVICADLVAMGEGIDLEAAVIAKFNATSEKVGLRTRLSIAAHPAGIPGRDARTIIHDLLTDLLSPFPLEARAVAALGMGDTSIERAQAYLSTFSAKGGA